MSFQTVLSIVGIVFTAIELYQRFRQKDSSGGGINAGGEAAVQSPNSPITEPKQSGAPTSRALTERSADERSADERSADERSADERSADERSADERSADERSADERSTDERSSERSGVQKSEWFDNNLFSNH